MLTFLLRRMLTIIAAVLLVFTVTFIFSLALPGGPFNEDKNPPPQVREYLRERYHLDDPLGKQYLDYLGSVVRLDLGASFKYQGRSVKEIITEGAKVSAALGAVALLLALGAGLGIGAAMALTRRPWIEKTLSFLVAIGLSLPSFVLAGFLLYIFAYKLRWLPPAMWGTPQQAVLPALALAAWPAATIARLSRETIRDVMRQPFILAARLKGLPRPFLLVHHVCRNAAIPILAYLGPIIAATLTGSFVIEYIFAVPGIGRHFVYSVMNRDYPLIIGLTVFYSSLFMAVNLLVDLVILWADPRIRLYKAR
ncbi:MAG: ABC transporter permease [Firmicutes bacterium]|nr:ABC transporter permease [Bacillota bacterium]